ncbi:MAG: hypothetical protein JOZ90_09660 [Alphaproteobacteria bacterium]|nr:hypothetical protein [Alphaproteobacteria bacterium]MBV9372982.1 hypothetical protein [Alphaproteobacteria bacterium]MBV9901349.1 hypothetical protein [Alphaproteobacteria bacterium]
MLSILLLALAAPPASAPVMIRRIPPAARPAGEALAANLKPDLVIKEMRKEAPGAVHVLVLNQGTGPSTAWARVEASASFRSRHGYAMDAVVPPLAAGESRWVTFAAFVDRSESSYPGKPAPTLADWETVSAEVDGYVASGTAWGSALPPVPNPEKNPCTPEHGCVVELDETNNALSMPIADMPQWSGG